MREGRADPEAAERALVRKPQIGDTRRHPAPPPAPGRRRAGEPATSKKSRRGRGRGGARGAGGRASGRYAGRWRRSGKGGRGGAQQVVRAHLGRRRRRRRCRRRAARPGAQRTGDRPLPDGRPGAPGHGPSRRARGPQPHRALRLAARRRHQPDPRQHLRRSGAERAARHGGCVRRHRHAEERRALPR